jgi:hypothetical protein
MTTDGPIDLKAARARIALEQAKFHDLVMADLKKGHLPRNIHDLMYQDERGAYACLEYAIEKKMIPADSPVWGERLNDKTVAHHALRMGRLPETFTFWELRDGRGRTVAEAVFEMAIEKMEDVCELGSQLTGFMDTFEDDRQLDGLLTRINRAIKANLLAITAGRALAQKGKQTGAEARAQDRQRG